MNKTLLAAAVAGFSMVAASSAYALDKNPNQPVFSSATTGSSLLLTVWDYNSGTSYNQILEVPGANKGSSITLDSFLTGNSFAKETISSTAWSAFSSTVTWGSDQVVYEVQAATASTANPSFGLASTVSTQIDDPYSQQADNAAVLTEWKNFFLAPGDVQNFAGKYDGYLGFVKTGIGQLVTSGNDAASTGPSSAAWNASVLGYNVNNGLPGTEKTLIAVGTDAAFFFGNTSTDKVLGNWNFSVTGGQASLSYTPVAAVPVPAAAWMMLSGVVGMLSMHRRNKKA